MGECPLSDRHGIDHRLFAGITGLPWIVQPLSAVHQTPARSFLWSITYLVFRFRPYCTCCTLYCQAKRLGFSFSAGFYESHRNELLCLIPSFRSCDGRIDVVGRRQASFAWRCRDLCGQDEITNLRHPSKVTDETCPRARCVLNWLQGEIYSTSLEEDRWAAVGHSDCEVRSLSRLAWNVTAQEQTFSHAPSQPLRTQVPDAISDADCASGKLITLGGFILNSLRAQIWNQTFPQNSLPTWHGSPD